MSGNNIIAISIEDYLKYGCPYCGCDSARGGFMSTNRTHIGVCRECEKSFVILHDKCKKSDIGFGLGDGKYAYPELQEHPRKGIPWHPWIPKDDKPEYGEYWKSRGIGYDLSGFVKTKVAGERLLEIVKEVTGKEEPESWLDYREFEPEWIQFKFQKSEFNLELLDKMAVENGNILTKEILEKCFIRNEV